MFYRTYRCVRYRYGGCIEHAEVSGTGVDVVPNLPKGPAPVSMSYRLTEWSYTGIDALPVPTPVQTCPVFHARTCLVSSFYICCSQGTLWIIDYSKTKAKSNNGESP